MRGKEEEKNESLEIVGDEKTSTEAEIIEKTKRKRGRPRKTRYACSNCEYEVEKYVEFCSRCGLELDWSFLEE